MNSTVFRTTVRHLELWAMAHDSTQVEHMLSPLQRAIDLASLCHEVKGRRFVYPRLMDILDGRHCPSLRSVQVSECALEWKPPLVSNIATYAQGQQHDHVKSGG